MIHITVEQNRTGQGETILIARYLKLPVREKRLKLILYHKLFYSRYSTVLNDNLKLFAWKSLEKFNFLIAPLNSVWSIAVINELRLFTTSGICKAIKRKYGQTVKINIIASPAKRRIWRWMFSLLSSLASTGTAFLPRCILLLLFVNLNIPIFFFLQACTLFSNKKYWLNLLQLNVYYESNNVYVH